MSFYLLADNNRGRVDIGDEGGGIVEANIRFASTCLIHLGSLCSSSANVVLQYVERGGMHEKIRFAFIERMNKSEEEFSGRGDRGLQRSTRRIISSI